MQIFKSYRDQTKPTLNTQADSICAKLLIYHLEIIMINSSSGEFMKKTTLLSVYNELILHQSLLSFTVLLCHFLQGLPGLKCVCCPVLLQAGLL